MNVPVDTKYQDNFINSYKVAEPPYNIRAEQNLRFLLSCLFHDEGMQDIRYKAYVLATVLRECGPTFEVAVERGPLAYFKKYDPGTTLGKVLGNTQMGDGFKFRGRGYVQLTGRNNYTKFSKLLNEDLLSYPDNVLDEGTSYAIMSEGMLKGLFTGISLSHYINSSFCDYVNARRIINGVDHAGEIAISARLFEKCLQSPLIVS